MLRDIPLTPFTVHTITDARVFKQELERIRQSGVAYDREETQVGLSCVAAPVSDYTGEVIAALSGLNPRELLIEMGLRQAIAGQEDWLLDVAVELAQKRNAA
jgi:DNA-binding IclR family transcriptional regulator